ncbi:LuxR C-terminal-related transcriptional regulator [Streptomyces sp. WAC 06725]|uniref:LuxR C-terminal-related transcriptional regulator n=1 Tax=Streptomyces sp. WAC 06725 TaxID=2203209 RepID=UPI0037DA66B8
MADGLSNSAIVRRLHCSPKTVEKRTASMSRKLRLPLTESEGAGPTSTCAPLPYSPSCAALGSNELWPPEEQPRESRPPLSPPAGCSQRGQPISPVGGGRCNRPVAALYGRSGRPGRR